MNANAFLSLMVLTGLVGNAAHADPKYWLYKKMLREQQAVHKTVSEDPNSPSDPSSPEKPAKRPMMGTFNQILNHFARNGQAPQVFKQRYFIDSSDASGPNAPVIFYLCGESECSGASDEANVNELAKKYKAHRVALEHRYYGKSVPFARLTTANLQFLSMDQALEDLATFQRYAQTTLKMTGKWITVGGSYPGEMSAFYRVYHPELTAGALASSAPVLAKADFFEYDRHVARVAGPQCLAVMQKVVRDVEAKLRQRDSAMAVKRLFQAEKVQDDDDFLYVIADMGAAAIQYGFQKVFCKTLIDGDAQGKATEGYASAGIDVFARLGTNSFKDSFQSAMSLEPGDLRPWMYQSCTEFGFYQTANPNPSESARSTRISLPYHNKVCQRLFGITQPVNTALTNKKFFEKLFDPRVKNILFTNGSNDPWSNLSITSPNWIARNPGLKMFILKGASHCSDFGSRDSAVVAQAQDIFSGLVNTWLTE